MTDKQRLDFLEAFLKRDHVFSLSYATKGQIRNARVMGDCKRAALLIKKPVEMFTISSQFRRGATIRALIDSLMGESK